MTDGHELYRDWAGAYVLGALEPAERLAYEHHLRGCAQCRADVSDFAVLPGMLAQSEPPDDAADNRSTDRITRLAVARANDDYARLRSATRRWRVAAVGAAAAVIILAAAIGVATLSGGGTGGTELALEGEAGGRITIEERAWGTSIDVDLWGLPQRAMYQLWAIDHDGIWTSAASWTATPEGLARVTGAAAVATDAVDRVVITSADVSDVLVDALAPSSPVGE